MWGSFLRPQAIKTARAEFKAGEITREQLTAVENEQITLLIEKQKRAGYHAITDGEFRRSYWHLDFMWGFAGIRRRSSWTTVTTSKARKPHHGSIRRQRQNQRRKSILLSTHLQVR